MNGYSGKFLRVDLGSGQIRVQDVGEDFFYQNIGGSALATKLLYDEVPSGVTGLDPQNKLIFALGPYQGCRVPGSGKWTVVAKSPLTNTFAVSTAGASWGHQLKRAGYDALIIEGEAAKPVMLHITSDRVELLPAEDIWGADAVDTAGLARRKVDNQRASVAAIGPAGEKQVAIACIVADEHSFAGRCGFGAVMGKKKLKAIVAYGNKGIEVANSARFEELRSRCRDKLLKNAQAMWKKYGTSSTVDGAAATGDFPLKNWDGDVWDKSAKLNGDEMIRVLNARSWPCFSCPVGCHRHISVDSPPGWPGLKLEGAGPEYESLGLLGGNCLVDDLVGVAVANDLCNRLGVDSISAGAFVGFTMECYEKGLVTSADLGGIQALWGDVSAQYELIRQIGNREGFGAIFAHGIRGAAQEIGNGAENLTVEVKNLDFPAHDPRTYFSLGINYATCTRGACHLRGYPHFGESLVDPTIRHEDHSARFDMEGKSAVAIKFQDWCTVQDSLVVCMFMYSVGLNGDDHCDLLNAITGWDKTIEDLLQLGEKAWNMQRLVNIGDGLGRADDRLPRKMFEPGKNGFRAGHALYDFDHYMDEYYYLRGWDKQGIPTSEKLAQLQLA